MLADTVRMNAQGLNKYNHLITVEEDVTPNTSHLYPFDFAFVNINAHITTLSVELFPKFLASMIE